MLVSVEQLKKETNQVEQKSIIINEDIFKSESTKAVEAIEEKPLLTEITKGNILGADMNLAKRKDMISAKGLEPAEFAFERAIGKNDSLYSNFAELIALTKRKVGRIVIKENGRREGFATGFMVSNCLMLTNWHVFRNKAKAIESEIHFFYEYDTLGHPTNPTIFKFDVNTFFYNNETLDYCFVAVKQMDETNTISLDSVSYLYLDKGLGKLGELNVEKLNIIHHPQGDYKHISIRENTYVGIEPEKIFYFTDTAPGSSGSPVFNDQWQVVGLHHKSIAKMTADGQNYLDEQDQIIPVNNGQIDTTRIVWQKNEGIRISVILKHLAEKYPNHPIVKTLEVAPPIQKLSFVINTIASNIENDLTNNINNNTMATNNNSITINVPTSALSSENSIEISLSSKKLTSTALTTAVTNNNILPLTKTDEALLEIAKIDKENGVDFSKCKGYNSKFLGIDIPMPKPMKSIVDQIAKLKNKKTELKYFKYSVLFNAVTKMPLISVINVEGDASKRLDNSKRKDDWLRDSRIPIENQLTDKYYAGSHFDKGHMSRFEDANWDNNEDDALRNGIYTCFYTNACPQVVALNRGGGLWGKLEKLILEKGIKKEAGKLARMTVMNGPIFNTEKDRIFRGNKIPMEFFKIILWLNDQQELKATAFKLSQEFLLDPINFNESMIIDEEAIDIDKDVTFKEFQIKIKTLSQLTKIDFKNLEPFDTFKATRGGNESFLENEEMMEL